MIRGILAYIEVFPNMIRSGFVKNLILILVISVFLFLVFGTGSWKLSALFEIWLENILSDRWDWLATGAKFAGFVGALILMFLVLKYIMLIIAAPVLSKMSEAVEKELTDSHPEPLSFLSSIVRGIRITLRNLVREIPITLILVILGFIPVVGIIFQVIAFFVGAYFAGIGFLDVTLERFHDYRGRVQYFKSNRLLSTGIGIPFSLLFLVPIIGWTVAPLWAVSAGTSVVIKRQN